MGEVGHQEEPSIGHGVLRVMGFVLIADIISLLLGVAFFLIAHGVIMGTIRLAAYWQPANRVVQRIAFGHTTSGSMIHLTTLGATHIFTSIALIALLVGFGIWLLISLGFLGQNFFWIAT